MPINSRWLFTEKSTYSCLQNVARSQRGDGNDYDGRVAHAQMPNSYCKGRRRKEGRQHRVHLHDVFSDIERDGPALRPSSTRLPSPPLPLPTLSSQITIHSTGDGEVDYYEVVLDERGNKRRFAVKRMPWRIINRNLADPAVREVIYLSILPCLIHLLLVDLSIPRSAPSMLTLTLQYFLNFRFCSCGAVCCERTLEAMYLHPIAV